MLKKSFSKTKPVCKVTFSLPFEAVQGGSDVRVLGDFNNWSWSNGFRMKASKGEFTTEVEIETGKEYQFRYLIDNHMWENDWNADKYVPAAFGEANSVLSLVQVAEATNGNGVAKKVATVNTTEAQVAPAVKAKALAAKPAAPKAAKVAPVTPVVTPAVPAVQPLAKKVAPKAAKK